MRPDEPTGHHPMIWRCQVCGWLGDDDHVGTRHVDGFPRRCCPHCRSERIQLVEEE